MIRRPPRSTLDRSSAASDVYKRQLLAHTGRDVCRMILSDDDRWRALVPEQAWTMAEPVSYTHLRAHETVLDLVCRLLLEKKQKETDTLNLSREKTQMHSL